MFRHILPLLVLLPAPFLWGADTTLPLGNGVTLTVVKIEPGAYRQGSTEGEAGRATDETARAVTITRPFYLGKFPVTRGQFSRFASDTSFRTEAEKGTSGGFGLENGKLVQRKEYTWKNPGFAQTDDDPIVMVTWNDAKAFLAWLSRKTGTQFDLPTEAQWEYACRAGTSDRAFPDGVTVNDVAWHKGNSEMRTHPVGAKSLNAWGLGDMLGNVWEWCADWYGPWGTEMQTDPIQTNSNLSDKPRRVLRGGSFLKDPLGCRPAARFRNDPQSRNADNGFRVMAYTLASTAALESNSTPPPPAVALEKQNSQTSSTDSDLIRSASRPPVPVAQSPVVANRLGSAFGGLGCTCLVVVLVLFFVRRLFKGEGGTSAPSLGIPGVSTGGGLSGGAPRSRIVDDGFWIEGGNVPVGTRLRCRYAAGDQTQESEIVYDARPGGQFIYTGQRPTSVSIVVIPSGMGLGTGLGVGQSMLDDDAEERARERRRREEEEERRRRRSSSSAY